MGSESKPSAGSSPVTRRVAVGFCVNGVTYFAWSLSQPQPPMAGVSAAAALVGAAAFALWMIYVALGMRSPHSAGNASSEQP